ncbi:hypothetical protein [Salana multivorans]
MTDWQHTPTRGQPWGFLLAGALCMVGGAAGLVVIPRLDPSLTFDDPMRWILVATVALGLTFVITGTVRVLLRRRHRAVDGDR